MKKKILAVLTSVVSFGVIFTGCAGSIKSGTVTDKEYNPAYTSTIFTRIGNVTVPHNIHHSAKYEIKLSGEENGEKVTGWIYVSEETYNSYNIGDYYP